ncbi:hypothetical protein ACFLYQ_02125 [Chloroflexota bacterium]
MGKYDKHICTELHKRHMLPGPSPEERDQLNAESLRVSLEHVHWIDADVIPGSYYGESTWIWPGSYPNQISMEEQLRRTSNPKPMFPHVHDFPELLSWWSTDLDNPDNYSDMGMIMGDEEIPLTRSWLGYVPAGMIHMPTRKPDTRVSSKPIIHWTSGPGGVYTREKDEAEKADKQEETAIPGAPKKNTQENLKYFIFEGTQENIKRQPYMRETDPRYTRPIAIVNDDVIPGAEFGCETMWLLPGENSQLGQLLMDPHTEPHGTSIVIYAMNYEDTTDLCAEVELWIDGEKHLINKGFAAYIPPNVEQGPMIIRDIQKQTFFLMSYPIGDGVKKYRGG